MESPGNLNPDSNRPAERRMSPDNQAPPTEPERPAPGAHNDSLTPEARRFEREGWLGLIITLTICTIAFILWLIFHKSTDAF